MSVIDVILDYVRRTNPEMTRDELKIQLGVCPYSTQALYISCVGNSDMVKSKEKREYKKMAKLSKADLNVSFECSDLIEMLEKDIAEMDGEQDVFVLVQDFHGVAIFRDYDFSENAFHPKKDEFVEKVKMSKLLQHYKDQNRLV